MIKNSKKYLTFILMCMFPLITNADAPWNSKLSTFQSDFLSTAIIIVGFAFLASVIAFAVRKGQGLAWIIITLVVLVILYSYSSIMTWAKSFAF